MSSLYLHIPFCSRKCPYCDFFSQVGTPQQIEDYVTLLQTQLKFLTKNSTAQCSSLETIFFGGGTPSLLTPRQIESLLNQIRNVFSLQDHAEITLEANPGTLKGETLLGYRQAGVNRISIGVQSLNNNNLKTLGRIHTVEQVGSTVAAARNSGFENINLDLMFGLPGQSSADLEKEVHDLLKFSPEHISLYGLSYEEGTDFYRQLEAGILHACDDDLYAEQYRLIHDLLAAAGFIHYEISNFSRPGYQCQHNQTYWKRQTCHALGAGAHSFIDSEWGERWHVPADLVHYEKKLNEGQNPNELLERHDYDSAQREYIYLALRTQRGLNPEVFATKFGCSFATSFATELRQLENYLTIDPASGCYSLTLSGWLIYDHLISYFL